MEASNSLSRKRNSHLGCLCNPYGLLKRSCPGCQDNHCWFAPNPLQDKRKTNAGFGANRLECNYNPYGWQKQAVRFALTRFQVWDQYLSVLICDPFEVLQPTFRKAMAPLFGLLQKLFRVAFASQSQSRQPFQDALLSFMSVSTALSGS